MQLSHLSKKWLGKLNESWVKEELSHEELMKWLNMRIESPVISENKLSKKNKKFILESIQYSLIRDYKRQSMGKTLNKQRKKTKWSTKIKLILLTIAGTVVFGCEGFDSITALISLIKIPSVLSYILVGAFSLFSIMVFYGFDLVQISNHLGVKSRKASKLIDIYLEQVKNINHIQKDILSKIPTASKQQLIGYHELLSALEDKCQDLDNARMAFKKALNRPGLKIAQYTTAAFSGILFFGGGYFTGQAVAMKAVGLFVSTVLPSMWPVVAISLLVGLAAFSIYWFVERPALQNLIGRWKGLDKDKIDSFSDEKAIDSDLKVIASTKSLIDSRLKTTTINNKTSSLISFPLKEKLSPAKPILVNPQAPGTLSFFSNYKKTPKIQSSKSLALSF